MQRGDGSTSINLDNAEIGPAGEAMSLARAGGAAMINDLSVVPAMPIGWAGRELAPSTSVSPESVAGDGSNTLTSTWVSMQINRARHSETFTLAMTIVL